MKIKGLLYWGYVDDQGNIFVKRYVNDRTIRNYESLPFVKGIFDPFEARGLKEAYQMVVDRYRRELLFSTVVNRVIRLS